ncbi:MAG: helix-turn-helix domain-containing protein [Kiritimatiellales bacterium]
MLLPYAPGLTADQLESLLFPQEEEALVTREEATDVLRVSLSTVDRMLRDGELPRRKVRGRVHIPLSALKAVMQGTAKQTFVD